MRSWNSGLRIAGHRGPPFLGGRCERGRSGPQVYSRKFSGDTHRLTGAASATNFRGSPRSRSSRHRIVQAGYCKRGVPAAGQLRFN